MLDTYDKRRPTRIVIIDDDAKLVDLVVGELRNRLYDATGFTSVAEGFQALAAEGVDLLIADIQTPEFRGTEVLHAALDRCPGLLVILITAFADVDLAVQALRTGAADFVLKPFKLDVLVLAIERALGERALRREIMRLRDELGRTTEHELVAHSEAMLRATELARKASRSTTCVFITGEAGTGKSIVARWIHEQGKHRDQPFVRVDCRLLHASIAESELFGGRDGEGMLAEASGGTILFDEIVELPIQVQSRVLRLLESSTHPTPRMPRVILSTNRLASEPLRERDSTHASVTARLEALGALHIHVPPLRDRVADIPDLVRLFLRRAAPASHGSLEITEPALRWLMDMDWPENASELAKVIEAAIALSENGLIVVDDVVAARVRRPESVAALMGVAAERKLSLADVEHGYIKRVIAQAGNNMTRAAQILGIDRRTLYRKLSESSPTETLLASVPTRKRG